MKTIGKKEKIIILIIIFVLLAAGIYYFINNILKAPNKGVAPSQSPVRGGVGFVEPTTTVKIGSKEVSKGNFQKVSEGIIYYEEGEESYSLPLTTDEVAVNCTDQSLDDATELDYKLVKKVKIYSAETIVGEIRVGEPIVVFASMVENTLKAHTIALNTASCP